ncbi:MAG: hypothetical protein N2487_00790 [Verrucomicrobiae bacterium]|nr:hypothetical protein [Verrucomicrobiae bacterium]
MNTDILLKKLMAAARKNKPSDNTPYAFEKRIMARIAELPVYDSITLWSNLLWRAAGPCIIIMIMACLWAVATQQYQVNIDNPSQAFELVVLSDFSEIGNLQ